MAQIFEKNYHSKILKMVYSRLGGIANKEYFNIIIKKI